MATLNWRVGGSGAIASADAGHIAIAKIALDCATNNVGSGDTVQVLDIPAGTEVLWTALLVGTPETAADTADLGDADSATVYMSNAPLNGTAGTYLWGDAGTGSTSVMIRKYYKAAGILSIHADAALAQFKGTLLVCMAKMTIG